MCDLLEGDIASDVRRAVLGFNVDGEWREAAIVSRTELILRNVFRCGQKIVADFLSSLYPRVLRVDHANDGDLIHALRVYQDVLADHLIDALLVRIVPQLNQALPTIIHPNATPHFSLIS